MKNQKTGDQEESSNVQNFIDSELSWRSFGLTYSRPRDFVDAQWSWMKPWLFTTYRVILALSFLVWISFDIPRETHNYFDNITYIWFVYATNWAFGLLTLVFFLLAVYCLVYNCPRRNNENIILYQPLWLMYTIALDLIIVVSLVFWVALSNSDLEVFASVFGKLKHSLAACLALLDLFISAIPIRLAHVIYPVLIGLTYSLFSYLFWLGNGRGPLGVGKVYPGLNWNHKRTAILSCLCAILFSFLIHLVTCIVCYTRTKLSARFGGQKNQEEPRNDAEKGYSNLGPPDFGPEHDGLSEASISTWVDERPSRYYGTVE